MPMAHRKPGVGGHKRRTDTGSGSVFPSGGRPCSLPCLVLKTLHFLVSVSCPVSRVPTCLGKHKPLSTRCFLSSAHGGFTEVCPSSSCSGPCLCGVSSARPSCASCAGGWGPPVCGLGALLAALGVSHRTPLPALGSRCSWSYPEPTVPHAPSPARSPTSAAGRPQGPSPLHGIHCAGGLLCTPWSCSRSSEPPVTRRWELCLCPHDTDLKTCCHLQLASPRGGDSVQ